MNMKKDVFAIAVVTAVLCIYCFLTTFEKVSFTFISFLFIALHFLLIWMVIRILKEPFKTEKTFDKYFYQDKEMKRNVLNDKKDEE